MKTTFKRGLWAMGIGMGMLMMVSVFLAIPQASLTTIPPSFVLLDRYGQFLSQTNGSINDSYGYWPLKTLPERVAAATLALEDQYFLYHPGVDPIALVRAAWQNLSSGRRISGASTIAMQVARLQHPAPRTYFRKSIEAVTAILLTLRYGRESVLKHYLTIVPFGNNGHGIRYAARIYLNKPVDDLSWAEIAFLTAIPHAPSRLNPYHPNGKWRTIKRGRSILKALYRQELIDEEAFKVATAQIGHLVINAPPIRDRQTMHAVLHMESLLNQTSNRKYFDKHPLISTTIDTELQHQVYMLAQQRLKQWQTYGAEQTAIMVTSYPQLKVLAFVGSRSYFDSPAGAINYGQVKRSSGSVLKPFIYALALEKGVITATTILDDLPSTSMGIQNADFQFLGPLLPRQALANSRNVTAVNLVKKIGLDETYMFMNRLGLHDNQVAAEHYGYGLAIGSLAVDLLSLVRAYGALANGGNAGDLIWFENQPTAKGQRLISKPIARQITLFLSDPLARLPSFPRMGTTEYPFSVALKTGTSQGYRDAWTVAYSNKYLVGAWVGRPDNQPMHRLSGAGSAAVLVKDILMNLHRHERDGEADRSFPPPEGYQPVDICTYTGKRNRGLCESSFQEWLRPDQIPEADHVHQSYLVDIRNGLLAGPWTPSRYKHTATFIELPAKYAHWSKTQLIASAPERYSALNMPDKLPGRVCLAPPPNYALQGTKSVKLNIYSPPNGAKIRQNTNLPRSMNSIGLKVNTEPAVNEVLWYVDGKPFKICNPLNELRWPLNKGPHTFQVKLPYRAEISKVVSIEVR